jgi:prepilin-type N-terminal cleavage/methylation domain-containing protein
MPSKGFTIIELIISIFILSVAVVGIFSAFSVMVILTADTADRLAAVYLAQEGMEVIRNIRDKNWLDMDACIADPECEETLSWTDGLINCASGCEADYLSEKSNLVPYGGGRYLKTANSFYNYASGTDTKFKRKIIITQVPDIDGLSDHIINVKTQVSWDKKATILTFGVSAEDGQENCAAKDNCIMAEETLYDWYNYKYQ